MTKTDFTHFYARRRQALGVLYKDKEFLYPNNEPWPEHSFDYAYGQAPTVSNIPPEEAADWQQNVAKYYVDNAVGTSKHPTPFGIKSAEFARERIAQNGISGYASLSDEQFLELICEGLYSKYLGLLDPQDEQLFGVKDDDQYQYLKSDQSCMRVVTNPWPGEYVAPSIAVVRRKLPLTDATKWSYELIGIALANMNDAGVYEYSTDRLFTPESHGSDSAWWLAKFFVLQGAIHRINLVDHIKVHFPSDTINAITKCVLPRWHLLQQLLLPHFRLTLPVNNAVLEGDRSIINRNTWYPWSPVTARGDEIRKLIPLAWAGGRYYWDERNTSYPRYGFSIDPDTHVDADHPDPIPTFIGLQASRYAEFLKDYHAPILDFARQVIAQLPDPPADALQEDLQWLEIQRWAHEISKIMPAFPNETEICNKEMLAQTCATIIWNAAVVHSTDHSTLHMMIDKSPVPFILRVRPPRSKDDEVKETIAEALGEAGMKYLGGALHGLEGLLKKALAGHHGGGKISKFVEKWEGKAIDGLGGALIEHLEKTELTEGSVPLCWPTDLIYAKMADLMFYRPHSSSLLFDCAYEFLVRPEDKSSEQIEIEATWKSAGRPVIGEETQRALAGIREQFQKSLLAVSAKYYDEKGAPVRYGSATAPDIPCVLNRYGFPKVIPGSEDTDVDGTRMECCFTAGIQY